MQWNQSFGRLPNLRIKTHFLLPPFLSFLTPENHSPLSCLLQTSSPSGKHPLSIVPFERISRFPVQILPYVVREGLRRSTFTLSSRTPPRHFCRPASIPCSWPYKHHRSPPRSRASVTISKKHYASNCQTMVREAVSAHEAR